jgi:transmembrane sensor
MLNEQISQEAAEWFVTLRYEHLDAGVQDRFMRWLRQSPDHVRAYLAIVTMWADLPAVEAVQRQDVAALLARASAETNVVALGAHKAGAAEAGSRRVDRSERTQHTGRVPPATRIRVRTAACVAFAVAALGALSWWSNVRMPTYATEVGEQRILRLPDGSSVELNSRSRIRVRFSSRERTVELIEGQALFRVAKDPQRVFLVRSGTANVRAVGTQFDVYRKRGGTLVTVVEGRVAVSPVPASTPLESLAYGGQGDGAVQAAHRDRSQGADKKPAGGGGTASPPVAPSGSHPPHGLELTHSEVLLSAGEQVLVAGTSPLSPTRANVAAVTSWTHGALMFTSEPLSSVVNEFNRYNTQRIVLDGSVEDFPITATFYSTDPRALIEFLKGQPELRVEKKDTEFLILAANTPPPRNY